MASIELSLACQPTDRTRAVLDGKRTPQGIDLAPVPLSAEAASRGMLRHRDFDAAAVSLAGFLAAVDGDDAPPVGIPVFPSRAFVHGTIYVDGTAGIAEPADLAERRVGIESSEATIGLWVRGILADRHAVGPAAVEWVPAGDAADSASADAPDALVVDRPPGDPFERLFPDVRGAERAYYRETGCFPILRVVVVRREIYDDHPWIAQELSKAFEAAKADSLAALDDGLEYPCAVPWLRPEIEATTQLMGTDFWPYGIEANREPLRTALRYAAEQGLTASRRSLEDLFAPETFTAFTV